MFREICGILLFTFLIHSGYGQLTLPPGVVKCVLLDDACFKRQMQSIFQVLQNDPSLLNVTEVQPVKVEEWNVLPGTALTFNQEYKNIKLYNHHFSKIIHAQVFNPDSPIFIMYFENPELSFFADYEFKNASYLGVSVTSKGKIMYREQGVHGFVNISTSFVKDGDKKNLVIDEINLSRNPSKVVFIFASGEAGTDRTMRNVFNNNWAAIVQDAGDAIENLYTVFYEQVMQQIFNTFTYEELFLDLESII